MSIVPLVKVTLYGPSAEKDEVLDGLQQLGCLHLNDLRSGVPASANVAAPNTDARAALQYLQDSPVRRHPSTREAGADFQGLVKEALDVRDRTRKLDEEREQLRKWIDDLKPWGDFELPTWAQQGPLRFWFYVVPHHQLPRVQAMALPWMVAARDKRFAYVVVVAADQPADMPVALTPLDPRSLFQLQARLMQVERELEELDYRRIGLTLHTQTLREALDEADDRAARERAGLVTFEQSQVFAVQGWAPRARSAALRQFAMDRKLALTIEPPGPHDTPPTLLDNPPTLRGGEGLVTFYEIPGYSTWDPSVTVFLCFAIFFAMIISDAGYGLLLALIVLATWKRTRGSSLRGILVALAIASILYGILVGTYFGLTPPAGSWLAALHVLNAEDQTLMMWIAIGIGVAQISYANLLTAWQRRNSLTALSSLGWTCMVLGGFCAAWGKINGLAQLFSAGVAALVLGGLLVLVFSSARTFGLMPTLLFGRLTDGLKELTGVSKAFGDVLSYLRLFALGLAAIKLAEVFNNLAASAFSSKGIWVLIGILVFLIGHSINFAMGIMSGVVHGLRLNVIEFFNWSLHEEGERFEGFSKKARS
jgi:V/A-type H+/Na+-transporting ATPase subunit I